MNFVVTVHVKPYVKRFLETNFGEPVNFRNHPRENAFFLRMLHKPSKHDDLKYFPYLTKYPSRVEIVISERRFYRDGWELSKTDCIAFGKFFERNAKLMMRTIIGIYISFGMPINCAILKFQERFKMEEEYWSFDTIQKDFFRYKIFYNIDFNLAAYNHLEDLIQLNMKNAGVMSKQMIKILDKTDHSSIII